MVQVQVENNFGGIYGARGRGSAGACEGLRSRLFLVKMQSINLNKSLTDRDLGAFKHFKGEALNF